MRGDILFFVASANPYSWDGIAERLIQWRTRGPYVHVEVDMGDGTSVAAMYGGVVRHLRPVPAAWAGIGQMCPPDKLTTALDWLASQVGDPYGWQDILDAAVGQNLPPIPGTIPGVPNLRPSRARYDCSHLTCRFLVKAGYPYLPRALQSAPPDVSPNDLARALGLIK